MKAIEHTFSFNEPFQLENGKVLPGFQLRYTTLGTPNTERSNTVWVCHALTGNSNVLDWWSDLFTDRSPFDPSGHYIVCANVLGGCYGSTGPLSENPNTAAPWFHTFPQVTVRDIVRALELLRQHLGIARIHTVIGGSLGGQQVLEWAIEKPGVFDHVIAIACNASHSPWGVAFNEAQRMAIAADPTWRESIPHAGMEGLKAARAIGMLSYRHYATYLQTQSESTDDLLDFYKAASYQRHQGEKLANRFNAYTYWTLSKAMDSHHVGRSRGGIAQALARIKAKALIVGIDTDILFPCHEQEFLANAINGAVLEIITSRYGHDGFLVECEALKSIAARFLQKTKKEIPA